MDFGEGLEVDGVWQSGGFVVIDPVVMFWDESWFCGVSGDVLG